jgi:hypothetical protein
MGNAEDKQIENRGRFWENHGKPPKLRGFATFSDTWILRFGIARTTKSAANPSRMTLPSSRIMHLTFQFSIV